MKKLLITSFFALYFLSGCTLLTNTLKYNTATKDFVEALLHKDYNKCQDLMLNKPDSLRQKLDAFRTTIVNNFGSKLNYSFVKAEKTFSTVEENNTPPNTTVVQVEFSNEKEFGIFQASFDDKSGKIINIQALDVKAPIPNMVSFWLFGILALCIPAFIIYMIVLIKRSDMRRKWQKYLFVILINAPAICYKAVGGLSVMLFNFQFLFGISFAKQGYLNSDWIFGIPIGGLIILWKLKTNHYKSKNAGMVINDTDEVIIDEENTSSS